MGGFRGAFATIGAHPILSLICLVVVTVLVVAVFSAGRPGEAWRGIWRVFLTLFTTPFEFLRNALKILRLGAAEEKTYVDTREFVLFRYSRLQYLTIFAVSVLVLSTTIAAALLAVYPQAELQEGKRLRAEEAQITASIAQSEQVVRDGDKPGYRQSLERNVDKAQKAFDSQVAAIAQKKTANTFAGPILTQIDNASTADELTTIRGTVDGYFQGCPDGISATGNSWFGWTAEQCAQYKTYVLGLIDENSKLFARGVELRAAREALDNVSNAVANAREAMAQSQQALEANHASQKANSIFAPRNIGAHLLAALVALLSGLTTVIVFVWVGAIAIDALNWVILLMRSLEAEHEGRLAARKTGTGEAAAPASTPPG